MKKLNKETVDKYVSSTLGFVLLRAAKHNRMSKMSKIIGVQRHHRAAFFAYIATAVDCVDRGKTLEDA